MFKKHINNFIFQTCDTENLKEKYVQVFIFAPSDCQSGLCKRVTCIKNTWCSSLVYTVIISEQNKLQSAYMKKKLFHFFEVTQTGHSVTTVCQE